MAGGMVPRGLGCFPGELRIRRRRVAEPVDAGAQDAPLIGESEDPALEDLGEPKDSALEGFTVRTGLDAYGLPLGANLVPDGLDSPRTPAILVRMSAARATPTPRMVRVSWLSLDLSVRAISGRRLH